MFLMVVSSFILHPLASVFHLSSYSLSTSFPLWLIVLGVLCAIIFSFWSYQRTVPPASKRLKVLLALLRWGALTGGILLLAQPELKQHRVTKEPANLLLLVDKSASMALEQNNINRFDQVRELLQGEAFGKLTDHYKLRFFTFSDSLEPEWRHEKTLADSPCTGVGTNLGKAWMQALEKFGINPPTAILLISDGAHNKGADPARLARLTQVPIWAIGVGSAAASNDLMIRSISASPVVYQGSKVPIEIGYRAVGMNGRTASVTLHDPAGKSISRKSVNINGSFSEGVLRFEIPVEEAGRQRFVAGIDHFKDELTFDNNHRSFYLNVLANRMRILIMAGPPDQGLGDLVRRLRNDEHVEIIQRTTRDGRFYEGDWLSDELLSRIDVVILHHFPVRSNNRKELSAFAQQIKDKNLPVGFIDGGQIHPSGLKLFEELLPVTQLGRRTHAVNGQVLPVHRHAVIADPDAVDIAAGWSKLPPVMIAEDGYKVKPQTSVLAEFTTENTNRKYPAIVVSEKGGSKSAALLMQDFWRWGLADPGDEGLLEPMLQRLIRWLAVRKVDKRVKLVFDKELFSLQEQVCFTVTTLDENYLPLDGVNVTAEVTRNEETGGLATLNGIGDGRYRGSFRSWGEGEYVISVSAQINETEIGRDQGKITVEPFSIELLDVSLNDELLKAIGEASGGGYINIILADSLFDTFDFAPVERDEEQTFRIWGKGWLLMVIIALLALEWLIRMRLGML